MQSPHSAIRQPQGGRPHSKWTTVHKPAVNAAGNKLNQRTPTSKLNNLTPNPSTGDHNSLAYRTTSFPGFENLIHDPAATNSGPSVSADDANLKHKPARVWSVSKKVGLSADSAHRDWLRPDEELLKTLMDDV